MKRVPRVCGVYKLVYSDGKVSVGASVNCYNRWRTHRSRSRTGSSLRYRAWRRLGEPVFHLVEEVPREDLVEREKHWKIRLNTLSPSGYDERLLEGDSAGKKLPESVRSKIRSSNTGKKPSPESIERRSTSMKQRFLDDPELRERVRQSRLGSRASQKVRDRMSLSQKRRYEDPEERRKTGKTMEGNTHFLGHSHSQESKDKIGKSSSLYVSWVRKLSRASGKKYMEVHLMSKEDKKLLAAQLGVLPK